LSDWNSGIIDEFRANEGRVGGRFEGRPILLLHHKGAKTGTARVNPLAYQPLSDDSWAIFASKGGHPTNPDWYYNLLAHPEVAVEIGTDTIDVTAREADGDEREQIWNKQKTLMPGFGDYEEKTTRRIPVIVLERR
jgi:deazaflavin-dependent oxidoreductase (nitroreductase family)